MYPLAWAQEVFAAFYAKYKKEVDESIEVYPISQEDVVGWIQSDQQTWNLYKKLIKRHRATGRAMSWDPDFEAEKHQTYLTFE